MSDRVIVNSQGPYEEWVLTLKQWQKDPMTSLQHLPVLEEADFSPTTWSRLLSHIDSAIMQVMKDWQLSLASALGAARSDHDLGRDLVQLRAVLARRVQLARHSGLPRRVSDALFADAESSIQRLQEDLEKSVTKSTDGARVDRSASDRLLAIVRANSLVHVLALETTQDGSSARAKALSSSTLQQHSVARAASTTQQPPGAPAPGSRRRVQFFDLQAETDH
jgi:hypothetical protein